MISVEVIGIGKVFLPMRFPAKRDLPRRLGKHHPARRTMRTVTLVFLASFLFGLVFSAGTSFPISVQEVRAIWQQNSNPRSGHWHVVSSRINFATLCPVLPSISAIW